MLDRDWNVLETHQITADEGEANMRPHLSRRGDTVVLSCDRETEGRLRPLRIDVDAFGVEIGADTAGGDGASGGDGGGGDGGAGAPRRRIPMACPPEVAAAAVLAQAIGPRTRSGLGPSCSWGRVSRQAAAATRYPDHDVGERSR